MAAEKGTRKNGPCNVTACQKPGANHWNTSTCAWYCPDCARKINEAVMSTPPLCVHPNNLPPCPTLSEDELLRAVSDYVNREPLAKDITALQVKIVHNAMREAGLA